jgi:replicative superfamily II helicase
MMGFHRTIVNKEKTINHLLEGTLQNLYNSESMIFMDEFSSFVRDLYLQKLSEKDIINILNQKQEENQNEMYQST